MATWQCLTLYFRLCGSSGAMFILDLAVEDDEDDVDDGRRNPTDCGDWLLLWLWW